VNTNNVEKLINNFLAIERQMRVKFQNVEVLRVVKALEVYSSCRVFECICAYCLMCNQQCLSIGLIRQSKPRFGGLFSQSTIQSIEAVAVINSVK
jgi:hypothetical protein